MAGALIFNQQLNSFMINSEGPECGTIIAAPGVQFNLQLKI